MSEAATNYAEYYFEGGSTRKAVSAPDRPPGRNCTCSTTRCAWIGESGSVTRARLASPKYGSAPTNSASCPPAGSASTTSEGSGPGQACARATVVVVVPARGPRPATVINSGAQGPGLSVWPSRGHAGARRDRTGRAGSIDEGLCCGRGHPWSWTLLISRPPPSPGRVLMSWR